MASPDLSLISSNTDMIRSRVSRLEKDVGIQRQRVFDVRKDSQAIYNTLTELQQKVNNLPLGPVSLKELDGYESLLKKTDIVMSKEEITALVSKANKERALELTLPLEKDYKKLIKELKALDQFVRLLPKPKDFGPDIANVLRQIPHLPDYTRVFKDIEQSFSNMKDYVDEEVKEIKKRFDSLEDRIRNIKINPTFIGGSTASVIETSTGGSSFTSVLLTSSRDVTDTDSFSRFHTTGATGSVIATLKTLATDDEFIFSNRENQTLTLQLDTGITLRLSPTSVSTSGGTIFSNKKGATLHVWAVSATELQAISAIGTWNLT